MGNPGRGARGWRGGLAGLGLAFTAAIEDRKTRVLQGVWGLFAATGLHCGGCCRRALETLLRQPSPVPKERLVYGVHRNRHADNAARGDLALLT